MAARALAALLLPRPPREFHPPPRPPSAAAAHTLVYARTGRPLLLARLPRPLPALHALLYSSVVTLPLVVTLVYWPLLFRPPWFPRAFDAWRNLSEHALNAAAALFELLAPRTDPLPWRHLPWLVLCMLAYLGLAFVTLAHQGFYTYRFLDHDRVGGRAFVATYVLGIALGLVVVFAAVRGLIVLRRWLTESKLGMRGHFAHPPALAVDAEMDAAQPDGPLSKEADAVA